MLLKMTLSDVQEFIIRNRRKLVIGLVVFVLVSLALGYIFQATNPQISEEDKIPSFNLAQEPGEVIGQIDLSNLVSADFPPSAPIYRIERIEQTLSSIDAVGWAKNFGFPTSFGEVVTPLGKIYVFSKTGGELTVTSNPRSLHYTRESGSGARTIFNSSTAIQKAKEFFTAKKLPDPGSFSPKVTYLSAIGERTAETIAAEAKFVEVNFSWSAGGFDLLGESPSDTAIRLIFDRSGGAVYLSYQFLDYSFSPAQEVPLLDFTQASDALRDGAQIVLVRPTGDVSKWTLSESSTLSSFAPDSVRLVYVIQTESEILFPVYLFEGAGRTFGNEVQAAAYVLAVPSQYVR